MTCEYFARRTAILSSSKTWVPPQTTDGGYAAEPSSTVRRGLIPAGSWRRLGTIGLLAATAEAANLAVNGVAVLPWPGLVQVTAGYAAFVAMLVWLLQHAGRREPKEERDQDV